jgi:DNA-binding transcriptional ArsR family regulator
MTRRLPATADLVKAAPPEVRAEALALLDRVSRPLTVREFDQGLRAPGLSKAHASIVSSAIKHLTIIAIIEGEG